MKAILSIYTAEAREFLRDRTTLLFVLLLPVAFAVFFGLIFSSGGGLTLQLGIANQDAGVVGANLVERFESPELKQVVNVRTGTRAELLEALGKGELHVVLVLPRDTSAALASRQPVNVEAFYDPARSASSGIGMGIIRNLINDMNLGLAGAQRLLVLNEQTVQAKPPRMIDFYMAGMLGVALLWLGMFGVAQPIVVQRQAGILRRFGVTAITRRTMLAGEVGWRVSVGIAQALIFLAVGYLGFNVAVKEWLPFAGAVLLGTLMFVCLGYTIAGLARSAETAMAVAQLINFPMMMLSGSIFDSELLPAMFKSIVAIMPLTYLSDILRQTMAGMAPFHPMSLDFAVLGAWFLVLLTLSVKLWRWE